MVTLRVTISAVLAIIMGLFVLAFPKFLRIVVGLYLVLFGILSLVDF